MNKFMKVGGFSLVAEQKRPQNLQRCNLFDLQRTFFQKTIPPLEKKEMFPGTEPLAKVESYDFFLFNPYFF